jgi:hypothetical protein
VSAVLLEDLARDPFLRRLARFHEAGDQAEELCRARRRCGEQQVAVAVDQLDHRGQHRRRVAPMGPAAGRAAQAGLGPLSSASEIGARAVAQLVQNLVS